MADLQIECYADMANDGNYPILDKFLGKKTISTLSSTSQEVQLEVGTKYVRLLSDATETVFFAFGEGSATAATTSQELPYGQTLEVGKNGSNNDYIAARIA